MDPAYGARYRELYERHWWWRSREHMVVRLLERLAPPSGFGDILDVGCGDGLFLPQLQRFGRPQGLEGDGDLVTDQGRAAGPITVSLFDEGFQPTERFGLIVMLDVIEHLDDDVAALRHAASLLADGGRLVITVPAFRALWTAHDDLNHHRTRYTLRTLRDSTSKAGLRVDSARYAFHWLMPIKLAVRLKERLSRAEPEMARVPPILFNRLAYSASRIEQATWGRLPLPFGTSVVAVCSAR